MQNPQVTITMQNGKQIVLELYPQVAPNTVNNFISLVNKGFYNGLIFSSRHPRIYDSGRLSRRQRNWRSRIRNKRRVQSKRF